MEGVVWAPSGSPEVTLEAKVGGVVFPSKGAAHAVRGSVSVWKGLSGSL